VREDEAQADQFLSASASDNDASARSGVRVNAPHNPQLGRCVTAASTLMAKLLPLPRPLSQSTLKLGDKTPKARLRQRLEKIRAAWDDFRASRARDAVYGYLEAVFAIVEHYKVRRRTKRLLRHAFKFC
jgi:hypothetical protein